jgi:cytoskeleton protein RodZ
MPASAAAAAPETAAASTAPAPAATAAADHAPGSASAAEVPLVLSFRGTSWAEVKDARGRVVLQMTGGAGMTQTVTAVAPLELALGNAPEVDVTFRGRALDLAPYTRGSVARVALK